MLYLEKCKAFFSSVGTDLFLFISERFRLWAIQNLYCFHEYSSVAHIYKREYSRFFPHFSTNDWERKNYGFLVGEWDVFCFENHEQISRKFFPRPFSRGYKMYEFIFI